MVDRLAQLPGIPGRRAMSLSLDLHGRPADRREVERLRLPDVGRPPFGQKKKPCSHHGHGSQALPSASGLTL